MISAIIFFLTYISGLLASLALNPIYIFALYEAVYFLSPKTRFWGLLIPDVSYSFIVVVVMMGLVILNLSKIKHNHPLQSKQLVFTYLLIAIFWVAGSYAVLPPFHDSAAFDFIKLGVIITLAYMLCRDEKDFDIILYGYIFGAWYNSFLAYQIGRNSGDRLEGIGTVDSPDANGIAAAIAPSLVLCLYYFWVSRPLWAKALMVFAGVFIANALILINSRGAILGVAIGISYFMLYMYFSSFQRQYQKKMAIFITIAGLAGSISLMDDSFIDRMKTITQTEVDEEKESGATRTVFWMAAWELAKDHPLGNGSRGFNYYSRVYIPQGVNTGFRRFRSVHSSWFEALTEVGFHGFITFLLILYFSLSALNKAKKKLKEKKQVDPYFKVIAIQGGFLTFFVAMTFLNRMRAEILYWLVLYSAIAYNIYVLKSDKTKTKQTNTDS